MSSARAHHPRRDIHAEITNRLIAAIEKDPGRPQMPWRRGAGPLWMPVNAESGKPYRGINVVSLWVAAEAAGFSSPIWATYKVWSQLGAQVKKGERGSPVVFYKEYDTEPDPDDAEDDGKRRVARGYWVFNCSQVDGYAPPDAPEKLGPVERLQRAQAFIAATGARIAYGGAQAFYRPSTDTIHMPDEALFTGTDTMSRTEALHAVEAHELVHWSGARHRLGREFGKRFGDRAYCAEELVAEIGSALLCAELDITQDVRADHAQYLAQWLELMKEDSRAIFTAAAQASRAVEYLEGLQPGAPSPPLAPGDGEEAAVLPHGGSQTETADPQRPPPNVARPPSPADAGGPR